MDLFQRSSSDSWGQWLYLQKKLQAPISLLLFVSELLRLKEEKNKGKGRVGRRVTTVSKGMGEAGCRCGFKSMTAAVTVVNQMALATNAKK